MPKLYNFSLKFLRFLLLTLCLGWYGVSWGNIVIASNSVVQAVVGSESTTVSSVLNTAGPLAITQGTQVWSLRIFDGDGTTNDADVLPTIVSGIKLTQEVGSGNAVNDWGASIQSIALFNGTTLIATGTVSVNQIQFTFSNITIPDGINSQILTIRLTLKTALPATSVDNDDFVFSLRSSNITTGAAGVSSQMSFSTFNSVNEQNKIDVIATRLQFVQQPPASIGLFGSMIPAVTVAAADANGNQDINYTGTVNITSTGTMDATPKAAALSSGLATFNNIIHTAAAVNRTLNATLAPLTAAASANFTVNSSTVFEPGDFVILAVNTTTSTSGNEISFMSFKPITTASNFDITDNGYERSVAASVITGTWGDTEGAIRFTYTGTATIPAGTIITVNNSANATTQAQFQVRVNGTEEVALGRWTISLLNTGGSGFDLNMSDQIWFLQGGNWGVITGTQNDTYLSPPGVYLYGWTASGWIAANATYNATSGSRLPPGMTCFNTDVNGKANKDKVKYTGPVTAATKPDWISRINNSANWTDYASSTAFDAVASPYNYKAGGSFSILIGNTGARWRNRRGDGDWFQCNNWENLVVPTATTDVFIEDLTAGAGTSPVIVQSNTNPVCRNLTITGEGIQLIGGTNKILTVNGNLDFSGKAIRLENSATNRIDILGNLTLTSFTPPASIFSMDDGLANTPDGILNLSGDWTNTVGTLGFNQGEGQVIFTAAVPQNLYSSGGGEDFYNLTINNTSSDGLTLTNTGNAIIVQKQLNMINGIINTGTNQVFVTNNDEVNALTGIFSSTLFINGTLRRQINKASNPLYKFPIGARSPDRFELATLKFASIGSVTDVAAVFVDANPKTSLAASTLLPFNETGANFTDLLTSGYWRFTTTPPSPATPPAYQIQLYPTGFVDYPSTYTSYAIVKRPTNGTGVNIFTRNIGSVDAPSLPGSGIFTPGSYLQRGSTTPMNGFSEFAIAFSITPLPLTWLTFQGEALGNTARLKWTTAAETNNLGFTVQKSEDNRNFRNIGFVDANATYAYGFTDLQFTGPAYYRLRQNDTDGKFAYSKTISLSKDGCEKDFVLYPNPATNQVFIDFPTEAAVSLRIFTTQGAVLLQTAGTPVQVQKAVQDALPGLPPQLYIVQIVQQGKFYQTKLVKQD
jgi:hypothetical protein